jgi:ParB family chromosome partitioning protein
MERLEARQTELERLVEEAQVYAKKDRAIAGCIVTIDQDGRLEILKGLVERSARRRGCAGTANSGAELAEDASGEEQDLEIDAAGDEAPVHTAGNNDDGGDAAEDAGFSRVLMDDLTAHRLQITKAHLAGDFSAAFDLALYALCGELLQGGTRARPLDLKAADTRPRSSLGDLAGTAADRLLEAHSQALDVEWLTLPPAEGFHVLCALPLDAKQRLFAWCIAACLNGQLALNRSANPVLEAVGERLAIPVAGYWRPTAANYWGRVKKSASLEVAKAILGPRWARDHEDSKKAALAAALEKAFDPVANTACIGLERAAREGAAAWLPPGMAYAHTSSGHDDAGAGDQPGDDAPAELPAFLTDVAPHGTGLNGACAP